MKFGERDLLKDLPLDLAEIQQVRVVEKNLPARDAAPDASSLQKGDTRQAIRRAMSLAETKGANGTAGWFNGPKLARINGER